VKPLPLGTLLAVVDGLGHGKEAAEAAAVAISTLQTYAQESIISMINHCHERLRGTRGVVMSLALFNANDGTLTWAGVGNVEGILVQIGHHSLPQYESLLLRSGVVGGELPRLFASTIAVARGDTLIFATDGVRAGFEGHLNWRQSPQQIADSILASHGRKDDDALVFVARYLGSQRWPR
jgi:serine phosphatase RsbU (regulator of sigma subunit)